MENTNTIRSILRDSYGPPSLERVRLAEKRLGLTFPDSYCEFLSQQNGGEFHDPTTVHGYGVEVIYGAQTGLHWSDLEIVNNALRGEFGPDWLVIASSAGYPVFLLDASNRLERGAIYADDGTRVGSSIQEFLVDARVDQEQITLHPSDPQIFQLLSLGDIPAFEQELKICSDINQVDHLGATLLMRASHQGRIEVIKRLIGLGADVHQKDETGDTALHYATYRGSPDAVNLLIKNGAMVDHLNNKNETALMVAVKYGYFRSAQALLECGADVFYTTPDGISLFDVCKNSKELFIPMLNSFQQKQARPK